MIRIFGIKTCDSCKRAISALPVTAEFIDVRGTPLSKTELSKFLNIFGESLVNKKSKTWRDLDENSKALTQDKLITKFPTVMKRPVIQVNSEYFLGWSKNTEHNIKNQLNLL
jgi:arsenate reductase-like glutaredoxin family protein